MSKSNATNSPDVLAQLLGLIERRLQIVADRDWYARDPAGHLAALQQAAADLDFAIAALPPQIDPMLRHFLEGQSYLKACDWLRSALQPSGTE
jgi:hypothetical protein